MIKRFTLILLLIVIPSISFAQLKKNKIGSSSKHHIGLIVGVNYPVVETPGLVGPAVDLNYTYYFIPRLGLRADLSYAYLRSQYPLDATEHIKTHTADISAQVVFNYFIDKGGRAENNKFSFLPERAYIYGGVGCLTYFCNYPNQYAPLNTATFPIGTGVQWAIGTSWALGIDVCWRFSLTDYMDNMQTPESFTDGFLTAGISVTYKIPNRNTLKAKSGYRSKNNGKSLKCDPRRGCSYTYQ